MPYIDPVLRRAVESGERGPDNEGELNYLITQLCDEYLGLCPRYQRLNAVIGVLECVKLELYRRVVAPFEDTKMFQNGDVYTERNYPRVR